MRRLIVSISVLLMLVAVFFYEWRYSDDMQDHINSVNRDLSAAREQELLATGLLGSLQAMTSGSEVAGQIISTHEHVHTVKDEVLAWKIKKAVQESITLRGAMQSAIAVWPLSI